uniref:Uncharacterized protein n=1 Tax=Anguilla anguilla TaxID=7936 RepID=A0A0E9WPL8_ANGAN
MLIGESHHPLPGNISLQCCSQAWSVFVCQSVCLTVPRAGPSLRPPPPSVSAPPQ